jgi:hypothetical protein
MLYYPVPTNTDMMRLNAFELVIGNGSDYDNLRVMCDSLTVQQPQTQVVAVNWMGGVYQLAGRAQQYTFNATFYVGVNSENTYDTLHEMYNWRNRVFNHETGKIALAQNYKEDATIYVYDVTAGGWNDNYETGPIANARYVYQVEGMWPTQIQDLTLDVSSTDVMKLQVQFAADKLFISKFGNGNNS